MGMTMSDAELAAKVRELTDRAEIHECMMRYARGMDRRDREILRSAYHDGAVDDHVGFVGEVDDFIDWAFAYHGTQTRYQHYLVNHTAEITGDTAHAETYYLFVGTDREPPTTSPSRAVATSTGSNGATGGGRSWPGSASSNGSPSRRRRSPRT
jgi:SnoaL-like domain